MGEWAAALLLTTASSIIKIALRIPPPRQPFAFALRHSHGGTGSGSAHRPAFLTRASTSANEYICSRPVVARGALNLLIIPPMSVNWKREGPVLVGSCL